MTRGGPPADPGATDWAQVRLLVGVRWTSWLRFTSTSVWRILGFILGITVMVGMATGLSFLAWAAGDSAAREGPDAVRDVVHACFFAVFVIRAASPLLGFQQTESLDVTKLLTLPASPRTVFTATFLGIAAAPGTWFWGVPLGVLVVRASPGAWSAAAGLAGVVAVVLAATAIGHLVVTSYLSLFRSRKWRDISMVVGSLVLVGLFAALRWSADSRDADLWVQGVRRLGEVSRSLLFLPSWWGAHAAVGDGPLAVVPLLAAVPLVWLCARATARAGERLWSGEADEGAGAPPTPAGARTFAGRAGRGPFAALVSKDLAILAREPGVRVHILQQLGFVALPLVFVTLRDPAARVAAGHWPGITAGMTGVVLLAMSGIALNPLGTEGPGLVHALATPVDRILMLRSKVAAMTLALGGTAATLCAAAAAATGLLGGAPGAACAGAAAVVFAESLASFAVLASVGAVVGVWFPHPLAVRARDIRASGNATKRRPGAMRALAGLLVVPLLALTVGPVVLGFRHPVLMRAWNVDSAHLLWLTIPAAFAWAALCAFAGTWLGGTLLRGREEAVVGSTLADSRA